MRIEKILRKIINIIPSWGCWLERNSIALELIDKGEKFVLDVGCGKYGGLFNTLSKARMKVISMDVVKDIDILRNSKFIYVIASAEKIPFKDLIFNQVICLDVLEHIRNDKLVAKEINRILKENGKLVITVPSIFWKFPYYKFMNFFSQSEEEILKLFGHFRKGYSISQIKSLFSNFEIEEVKYFINKISALAYDIEFSNFKILENIILKILALPLFLNFKLSSKKYGTHIGIRLKKQK